MKNEEQKMQQAIESEMKTVKGTGSSQKNRHDMDEAIATITISP